MFRQHFGLFICICLTGFFASCISVKVAPKSTHAQHVSWLSPSNPFADFESPNSDKAWQNNRNGNTISFLSQCQEHTDPTLDTLQGEVLAGLDDAVVTQAQKLTYNAREAVDFKAKGKIDGVLTHMHVRIFKKNNCIFTVSYIAREGYFDADQPAFEKFLKSLVVK